MKKLTIMDKVNDMAAFQKVMHEQEDAYVKWGKDAGETIYLGYDQSVYQSESKHKFCDDRPLTEFRDWREGICGNVMQNYRNHEDDLGCYDMRSSLDCLACGCRNYSLCCFLEEAFEDWVEFMDYCCEFEY